MLDQKPYYAFNGKYAHRTISFIDHRQMAMPPCLHSSNGQANRFAWPNGDWILGHDIFYRQAQGLSYRQYSPHQIAFREQANELAVIAHQHTPDILASHEFDRVTNC